MQIAKPDDVAALEWLEVEIRTVDARRPRIVDELAQAVSVADAGGATARGVAEPSTAAGSRRTCRPDGER